MGSIQYAPTGGNKRKLEFTIIDDCKEMDYFRLLVRDEMIKLANNGIYPQGFDKTSYNQMMAWEKSVRPDSIFCGAPHILIPHAPKIFLVLFRMLIWQLHILNCYVMQMDWAQYV